MNLSAAERSAGLGDKTLSQSFWLVCAEYYSQENELRCVQRSVTDTLFVCFMQCLRMKLWVCSCPEHLDSSEAQSAASPFKAHWDK